MNKPNTTVYKEIHQKDFVEREMQPSSFIRIDDVGISNDRLSDLLEVIEKNSAKAILGIIPTRVNEELRDLLSTFKCIEIAQHGYTHSQLLPPGEEKGEFSETLPIHENERRLDKGWEIICRNFKPKHKTFIPPWHTLPPIKSLLQKNYELFSSYGNKFKVYSNGSRYILSAPVNLDPVKDYALKKFYPTKAICSSIDEVVARYGYVGFLLHPNYLPENNLNEIDQIIQYIISKYPVSFFSEILKEGKQ